jgi:hypothetical protein
MFLYHERKANSPKPYLTTALCRHLFPTTPWPGCICSMCCMLCTAPPPFVWPNPNGSSCCVAGTEQSRSALHPPVFHLWSCAAIACGRSLTRAASLHGLRRVYYDYALRWQCLVPLTHAVEALRALPLPHYRVEIVPRVIEDLYKFALD